MFSRKPVNITGSEILSGFDATVLSIDCFAKVGGAISGTLEEQGNILMETFLVVFDLEDVIGFFVDDGMGNFFLTAHGINGDNGAFQS